MSSDVPEMVEKRLQNRVGSAWGGGGFGDTPNSLPYPQGTYQDHRARLFSSLSQNQMLEATMTKYTALQRAPSRCCSRMQPDVLQTHFFVISPVESPSLSVALIFGCSQFHCCIFWNTKYFMGWVFNIQEIMRSICEGEQNMLTAQVGGKVRGE